MGINMFFGSRLMRTVALGGAVALVAACQDVTGPEQAKELELAPMMAAQAGPNSALGSLASSLGDLTGWSMSALTDPIKQAKIQGTLDGLQGHLKSGQVALIQQDVTIARAAIESMDITTQVVLGHVGLALDLVQSELNKVAK